MKKRIKDLGQGNLVGQVKGSTGNMYDIREVGEEYTCSCIGYQVHKKCKHKEEWIKNV